jgi:hypothetical protein
MCVCVACRRMSRPLCRLCSTQLLCSDLMDAAHAQEQYREFKGGRNLESVEKFVYKVTGPPIPALKTETVKAFTAQSEIVFVSVGSEVEQATKDLADKYLDTIYIASAADASLLPGVTPPKKLPAVVALNSNAEGTDNYAQWYEGGSEVRHDGRLTIRPDLKIPAPAPAALWWRVRAALLT